MAFGPPKYPLLNGYAPSYGSLSVTIFCQATGVKWEMGDDGFSALDFDTPRKRGQVRSPHPDPRAKTRGQNEPTASMKFYKLDFDYLIGTVLGGAGWKDRFFTVTAVYSEDGLDETRVRIKGCTADTGKHANAKGSDPTEVEVDFSPLKILYNNFDDVDDPLVTGASVSALLSA